MKILLICCMLTLVIPFTSFANDNVLNRNGIFYDLTTNQKFTGDYTGKYIYNNDNYYASGVHTYRYKISIENGLRNGTATMYKSFLSLYLSDGSENMRTDSHKSMEANFSKGKILSVKGYNNDGVLMAITFFKDGVAKRYHQETGELIAKFGYIDSGKLNPPSKENKSYYLFFGNSYALDGESFGYKSGYKARMKTYKNNVRNGPFFSMHSKDQVFQQGSYSHGKMDGDYKLFCDDGRLGKHLVYLAGEVVETIVDKGSNYCYE